MREAWPPADSRLLVSFRVSGMPRPAGSKNAMPLGRRDPATNRFIPYTHNDGRPKLNMRDSSGEQGENWRADVRAAVAQELDVAHRLADGPLAVRAVFSAPRAKGHFGTGRNAGVLKATAPAFPHDSKLADGTKLLRAVEDALNMLVWTDDRRIVDAWWSRRFGDPGVHVTIYALPVRTLGAQSLLNVDQGVIMGGDEYDDGTQAIACSAR